MEEVRAAQPADFPRCAELVALARDETAGGRGGQLLAELGTAAGGAVLLSRFLKPTAFVAEWAGQTTRALLVGLFESEIVGLGAGTLVDGPPKVGRIDCCYVEPPMRGVGVGGALLGALVEFFEAAGCTGIDALALPGDRSSKQLLETGGFKARLIVMHRPLR